MPRAVQEYTSRDISLQHTFQLFQCWLTTAYLCTFTLSSASLSGMLMCCFCPVLGTISPAGRVPPAVPALCGAAVAYVASWLSRHCIRRMSNDLQLASCRQLFPRTQQFISPKYQPRWQQKDALRPLQTEQWSMSLVLVLTDWEQWASRPIRSCEIMFIVLYLIGV